MAGSTQFSLAATGQTDPVSLAHGDEFFALSGTWVGTVTPQFGIVSAAGVTTWRDDVSNAKTTNGVFRFDAPSRATIRFDFTRTSGTVVIDVWRP